MAVTIAISSWMVFLHGVSLAAQSQTGLYIYVQDALGRGLPAAQVEVMQEGVLLPVHPEPEHARWFAAKIDPAKAVKVSAKLAGYTIEPQEFGPDLLRVYPVVHLSAGLASDSSYVIGGVRTFFKYHPKLIGFAPTQKWEALDDRGELLAWEERMGLVPAASPWPEDKSLIHTRLTPRFVFYRRADGKPFPREGVMQLDSIRMQGWGEWAGVPLGPGFILTHSFFVEKCTAPQQWLDQHHLQLLPDPYSQGRSLWVEGPAGAGYASLDLLRLLTESGYFEGVAPNIIVQIGLD